MERLPEPPSALARALALTRELLESVAEEIAEVCVRTAVSSNIKERRDLSAAVFDGTGRMVAHAAHIPVHLGAMPLSVRAVRAALPSVPGTWPWPTTPTPAAPTCPT